MKFVKYLWNSNMVRSSGIYTISTVINSAIPFLILPILTRFLTTTDYGIVAMFSILLQIILPFVGLNIYGAISVKYFDKDNFDLKRYIGNCFLLLFFSFIVVYGITLFLSKPLSVITAFPRSWLHTAVLASLGQFIILVIMTLWQVQNQPFRYGLFQISQMFFNIGLTIFLVVGLHQKWQGRILAQLLTFFCFGLFAFFWLQKKGWIKFSYNKTYFLHALKFGIPLIPHTLGAIIVAQTGRFFITNMIGLASTGIYTVALQVAMIIEIFNSSFNKAYVPWLFKKLSQNDFSVKIKIVKITYLSMGIIVGSACFLSIIAPSFLKFFVGKQFFDASQYITWLSFSYAFNGMYYLITNYIFYAEKTHILAWVTFLTALISIPANYILIKLNGTIGAAQASALSYFMNFILTWILSMRVYPMPWNLHKIES